jgi:hypothetical protein
MRSQLRTLAVAALRPSADVTLAQFGDHERRSQVTLSKEIQAMARTMEQSMFEAMGESEPMTASEITQRFAVTEREVRSMTVAGYLNRDASGRYASWCAWPGVDGT